MGRPGKLELRGRSPFEPVIVTRLVLSSFIDGYPAVRGERCAEIETITAL